MELQQLKKQTHSFKCTLFSSCHFETNIQITFSTIEGVYPIKSVFRFVEHLLYFFPYRSTQNRNSQRLVQFNTATTPYIFSSIHRSATTLTRSYCALLHSSYGLHFRACTTIHNFLATSLITHNVVAQNKRLPN